MKKIISIILCAVMLLTFAVPAFAGIDFYQNTSTIPVVCVSGDGSEIVDKDGNELSKLSKLMGNQAESDKGDDVSSDDVSEALANVLKPFLIQGLLTNNWEPYYENLEKEIGDLFGDIRLDENGEPSNGSHLSPSRQAVTDAAAWENRLENGYYTMGSPYHFYYDWRLDPCANADLLYEFIQTVKNTTGKDEVAIITRCIGSNVTCAYLAKYGTDGIRGIGFDGVTCFGTEPISESMSGKFLIDDYAIQRAIEDSEYFGIFNLSEFVNASIDLAVKSGVIDSVTKAVKLTLYKKLVKGVTSALTIAAVNYPSYWACVKVEDFDRAVEYVFGEEGSEKRVKYAGFIEKITNYNETVKKHIPEILESLKGNVNVGVVAKYGTQMLPMCESRNELSDSFVSTKSSSFGATTSTIFDTLSDEYIAEREAAGYGKYISPDKQVDASTCIFPDSTWFVKGTRHSKWAWTENMLLYTVATADHQLTIDDFDLTQYMVPPEGWDDWFVPMTEENCNVEHWDETEQIENEKNFFTKLKAFIESFKRWFELFKELIKSKREQSAA